MKKITVLLLLFLASISLNLTTAYATSTDIIGPDVIHKQANHILTSTDILSLYTSPHGSLAVNIDNYTGYGNVPGVKTMELYVMQGSTVHTKQISIHVISTLGNVKAVTDYRNIHVRTDQVLTVSEIVYVLEKTGYVEITSTTQMLILANTYTASAQTPGSYSFEFRLVNSAGLDQIYQANLYVSDQANLFVPDVIFEAPPSAFDGVINFLITLLYIAIFGVIIYLGIKFKSKLSKGKRINL